MSESLADASLAAAPVATAGPPSAATLAPTTPSTRASTRARTLRALLTATRPRQWLKNLLVVAAPLAAGRWLHAAVAVEAAGAFAAITLTASGTYLLNDVADRRQDRVHPVKARRPVAAGLLTPRLAARVGVLLVLAGPALAVAMRRGELLAVVVAYALLTGAYSWRLKRIPGVEVLALATGFVLRPLAGAAATGVPPSGWFLAVCCTGALMVTLGKRSAELALVPGASHRPVLAAYTPAGLRVARVAAAVAMLGCYAGWAATRPASDRWYALASAVAVAVAVARYGWCTDRGRGGEPERLLLADRYLQVAALGWIVAFLAGPGHL